MPRISTSRKRDNPPEGMEYYTTGTGQKMIVHARGNCLLEFCVIHNPSDHAMKDFPTHWRDDKGLMERYCPHHIGHSDPDSLSYIRETRGEQAAGVASVHGCDGCH